MDAGKNSRRIDLDGQHFGRWTVMRFGEVRHRQAYWRCCCECGAERLVRGKELRNGHSRSCGCLQRETAIIHGDARGGKISAEYGSWHGMLDRCLNPRSKDYPRYGGRGITVCDAWRFGVHDLSGFEVFLADMGRKPSPQHSIDRYPDRGGGYRPDNCRWATPVQQAINRANTTWVKVGRKRQPITRALAQIPNGRERFWQWVKRADLSPQQAYERVIERAARGARQGQQ